MNALEMEGRKIALACMNKMVEKEMVEVERDVRDW